MAEFLTGFSNILWGAPVLILLGIVGLLYGIRTKFFQIRKMGYILKNTAGEMFKKGGGASGDKGTLTPLQAVCSALAGCVGTANIAGVATAMVIGGPGAVFWMWVIALLGMMTKCVEVTLGQYYRIQGKDGVYYGGPMYYIERGMGKKWKPLAIFFAVTIILGGLGTAAFAQPYTMSTALERTFHIPAWVVTVAAAAICGIMQTSFFDVRLLCAGQTKKRTASGVRMLHALRSCCVSATRASSFLADSGRKVKRRHMIFCAPGTLAHIERSGSDGPAASGGHGRGRVCGAVSALKAHGPPPDLGAERL